MSKVRINDLARELEIKSRQVLEILAELGMGAGKTHSSSLEEGEAEKVRVQFAHGTRSGHSGSGSSRSAAPTIAPKIEFSGAVVVDTLGAVTGPGGIQATTSGTDVTDSVTVITAGAVTGTAGAGIQARSVNGNSSVTASGLSSSISVPTGGVTCAGVYH